jgi:hypothetical protein
MSVYVWSSIISKVSLTSSGVSYVQVWWETLRIAALAAKLYLPVSCRAPLTFRLWSCSRSYNVVIKSGNFWTTQLVLRLITLLYDSLHEEFAAVKALNLCFPRATRVLCAKHLKDNAIDNLRKSLPQPEVIEIVSKLFGATIVVPKSRKPGPEHVLLQIRKESVRQVWDVVCVRQFVS